MAEPAREQRGAGSREDQMQRAMSLLTHSDRELLVLYHLEQQSLDAIEELLGVKVETLHVRLHRARQRLKTIVKGFENQ